MRWLSLAGAEELWANSHARAQTVAFIADVQNIRHDLPAPAREIPVEECPASPTFEWHGQTGNGLAFAIQLEQEIRFSQGLVTVLVPFPDLRHAVDDWTVIRELDELPRSIYVKQPVYIESRSSNTRDVVFRPHPDGWKYPIYNAANRSEAERLLEFLRRDDCNRDCFIAEGEPAGRWVIVREEEPEKILGSYPDSNGTIKVACEFSLKFPEEILIVKDISAASLGHEYRVSNGRVVASP